MELRVALSLPPHQARDPGNLDRGQYCNLDGRPYGRIRAMRLSPLPALNGLCWMIETQYQISPAVLPTMQTQIGVPNYIAYLFRQGCRAMLYQFQGNPEGNSMYQEWEETLVRAMRAADRQQDDNRLYPEKSLMSGYGPYDVPYTAIGAAYPFSPGPWF